MKRAWVYITAILVVLILGAGGLVYYFVSNDYVAIVGDEKVTKAEYKFFYQSVKNSMEEQARSAAEQSGSTFDQEAFWKSTIDGSSAIEKARQETLLNIQEFKILSDNAKKKGIGFDDEEKERIETQFEKLVAEQGGRVELQKKIKETYDITIGQYQDIQEDSYIAYGKFRSELGKEFAATDEEIKQYYEEQKDKEVTTVRHILFLTRDENNQPLPPEEVEKVKKKADDMLERVKDGEDFTTLVKEYSEDPGSKEQGGQYTFTKGEMVKPFEDWAFSAKIGDEKVVETDYGYHVMMKPTEEQVNEFYDTVKEKVRELIVSEKITEQIEEWKKQKEYEIKDQKEKFINSLE